MTNDTKPHILIVEDDLENQKFLQFFLRRKFEIDICDSDVSFYDFLANHDYDVILMDISLRGNKNGLVLTKEVKQNPQYCHLPVLCLTAHAFKRDENLAMEAGVDVFLTKPVENELLMNSLMILVENKRKKEQV